MLPIGCRACLIVFIFLVAAGCKGLFPSKGMPDDPLFLSRTPLEATAKAGPPLLLSYAQPSMPSMPVDRPPSLPTYASPPPSSNAGLPVNIAPAQK